MIKSETPHMKNHNFQTQFVFFFSLSTSIFIATLLKFQGNPLTCHSIRFSPCYFNYYFLFGIIYKIEIPIKFHSFFFLLQLLSPFFWLQFVLFEILFKIDFFPILSSLSFFSDQIWTSFFLLLFFFYIGKKVLIDIFFRFILQYYVGWELSFLIKLGSRISQIASFWY
jgi:hypothetical protein